MKKTIFLAAAIVAMTACNKNVIEMAPAEGFGYIDFGITADTEMVVVKSGTAITDDQYDSYNVTIKQGNNELWTGKCSEITSEHLTRPAGTYTLYVENLTEAEAAPASERGAVRVAGSADVIVMAGIDNPVTVNCVAINSRVTVANTFNKDVFTNSSVSITDGTRELPMTWGHEEDNGAYYSAEKSIGWNLQVTLADGTQKTYSKTSVATTVAKKWTQFNFTNSNTNGNIIVEIVVDGTITDTIEISETINPLEGTIVTTTPAN